MKPGLKSFNMSFVVFGLTSCLTTLQFSSNAWAQETSSQSLSQEDKVNLKESFMATPSQIQAPQSGFDLRMAYTRSEAEIKIKNIDGVATSSQDIYTTNISYALNSHLYFGTGASYESGTTRADMALAGQGAIETTNQEGGTDPNLFIGSRINLGAVSVIGNLDYLISTGKAETQRKSQLVTDRSAKNGGSEVKPSIAIFTNSPSKMLIGSSLSYDFKLERKTEIKDPSGFVSEVKTRGGNQAQARVFIQSPQDTLSFGAILSYNIAESTEEESLYTQKVDGSQWAEGSLFADFKVSKGFSIVPQGSYSYFINDKINNTDLKSQSFYAGQLLLKLMF